MASPEVADQQDAGAAPPRKFSAGQLIKLTTHPSQFGVTPVPLHWGKGTPAERGPIVATTMDPKIRNAIGTHSGSYMVYRALAAASGRLKKDYRPDLTNTSPAAKIGPYESWNDHSKKIVSIDPFGAIVTEVFAKEIAEGMDIRPTIAITKAHLSFPEIKDLMNQGKIKADGKILLENGDIMATKAAVEPVWYLPGVAERFNITESELRRSLFEETGGMFPELITRNDIKVFLPPIGGLTVYILGDPATVSDENVPLTSRVHDECNGSDVFGSDICTCRPYLVHGVQLCIEQAQNGGNGLIVYSRKEGRALGEVTKFLVYNARKRQEGGDRAETYFQRTECVAGVQDMRFQEMMPDVLHWLGIKKIDRFVSMSNEKYDAIVGSGIKIVERVPIPDDMVPPDARVEIESKIFHGYYAPEERQVDETQLKEAKGMKWDI